MYINTTEATSELDELRLTDDDGTESGDTELKDSVHMTHPKLSSVGRLLHAMSNWCTPETRCFVIDQVRELKTYLERDCVQQAGKESSDSDKLSHKSIGKDGTPCYDEEERKEVATREDMESVKVLPPVHSSGQSQLQRTIFVQQLKRKWVFLLI